MGDQELVQTLKKIVIIGGCGHVGLPLGIVFADCGLDVVLLDRDQAKIDTVNKGEMPFMETNALEQLGKVALSGLARVSCRSKVSAGVGADPCVRLLQSANGSDMFNMVCYKGRSWA
jgi:UDP-N-acetyl-D-mannosaminuronate dehydrogenase